MLAQEPRLIAACFSHLQESRAAFQERPGEEQGRPRTFFLKGDAFPAVEEHLIFAQEIHLDLPAPEVLRAIESQENSEALGPRRQAEHFQTPGGFLGSKNGTIHHHAGSLIDGERFAKAQVPGEKARRRHS